MPQGKRTMDGIDRCHTHAHLYGRRFLFASVYSLVCLWTQKGNAVRVPISSGMNDHYDQKKLVRFSIARSFRKPIFSSVCEINRKSCLPGCQCHSAMYVRAIACLLLYMWCAMTSSSSSWRLPVCMCDMLHIKTTDRLPVVKSIAYTAS